MTYPVRTTDLDRSIGARARILRMKRGLSLSEAAFAVEEKPEALNAMELGAARLGAAALLKLARLYRAPVRAFYAGLADGAGARADARAFLRLLGDSLRPPREPAPLPGPAANDGARWHRRRAALDRKAPMPPLNDMKSSLDHLPAQKRAELARVQEILFEEFEKAKGNGQKAHDRNGRILKIILFGSYARGDWVDERGKTEKGYQSDFDLLIVVNYKQLSEMAAYWYAAEDRIAREKAIRTPVSLIVHSLGEVNDKLAQGRYFFVDIARDGVALYELPGHRLVQPQPLTPEEAYETAKEYFEEWSQSVGAYIRGFNYATKDGDLRKAVFDLHQAVERLYTCFLLVQTNYSPSTHNIRKLRSVAEDLDESFRAIWPDEDKFQRRCFERLKDAYVKARYSKHYVITDEELEWLGARTEELKGLVNTRCANRLKELAAVL